MGCASQTCSAIARVGTGAAGLSVIVVGIALTTFHCIIARKDSVVIDQFYDNDAWVYSSTVVLIVFGIALLSAAFRPAGRVVCCLSIFSTLCAFTLGSLALGQASVITLSGFGDVMTWSPFSGKVNMHDSTMQQAVSMAEVCQPSKKILFTTKSGIEVYAQYDCGKYDRLQMAADRAIAAANFGRSLPTDADRDDYVSNDDFLGRLDDDLEKHPLSKLSEEYMTKMDHETWAHMLPTEKEMDKCVASTAWPVAKSACLFAPSAAVYLAWRFIVFGALMYLAGAVLLFGGLLSCCVGGDGAKNKKVAQGAVVATAAYQPEPHPATAPLATAPPLTQTDYPPI